MSEFGRGYAYNLGLFLAHSDRIKEYNNMSNGASLWFNGAADHLFELEIPEIFSPSRKEEIKKWRDICLKFRLDLSNKCTFNEVSKAIQYAKDLLREWDQLNNIPSEKGDWE